MLYLRFVEGNIAKKYFENGLGLDLGPYSQEILNLNLVLTKLSSKLS